jgi:hypothetical protein
MECLVGKCVNKDDQGNGFFLNVTEPSYGKVGHEWICSPCWDAMRNYPNPQYSQIFRNMKKHMFKSHHDVDKYYETDYDAFPKVIKED